MTVTTLIEKLQSAISELLDVETEAAYERGFHAGAQVHGEIEARLRRALEFYANPSNHHSAVRANVWEACNVACDRGDIARTALSAALGTPSTPVASRGLIGAVGKLGYPPLTEQELLDIERDLFVAETEDVRQLTTHQTHSGPARAHIEYHAVTYLRRLIEDVKVLRAAQPARSAKELAKAAVKAISQRRKSDGG